MPTAQKTKTVKTGINKILSWLNKSSSKKNLSLMNRAKDIEKETARKSLINTMTFFVFLEEEIKKTLSLIQPNKLMGNIFFLKHFHYSEPNYIKIKEN